MSVRVILLGTGASAGVPSFYCGCKACLEAKQNPQAMRTRSGAALLSETASILLDAGPDLQLQLNREGIEEVDAVFLSHWHYDHFAGLGELEAYVRLKRMAPIKLYLPEEAIASFQAAFPFLLDIFELISWNFEQRYDFHDFSLTPLPAAHGIQTAGFFLQAERSLAYFPDTADLPESTAEKIRGTDFLIADATFYGENWFPATHLSIAESIALGRRVKAQNTILTHLAMHYSIPVTAEELQKELAAYPAVSLGYDGLSLQI